MINYMSYKPTFYINEPDCSLTFHYTQTEPLVDVSMTIPFSVDTEQQIKSVILTPENIITDLSSNLEVILHVPTTNVPTITIDPSYIAYLDGSMTSSDNGLTWNGTIYRTENMNLLGNTLTVSIDDISSNIIFDVVENENLLNIKNISTIDLSATVVGNQWDQMNPSLTTGQNKNLDILDNPEGSHIFVMKNIKFPESSSSEGCLLEHGGSGIGMFIGIVDNKFIFGAGNGGHNTLTDVLSSSNTGLVQVDVPSDTNEHEVVGYYNGTIYTISFYIDGIKIGHSDSVSSISGGDFGGFLGVGRSCVGYGSTNDWPERNSNTEELYLYVPSDISDLDINTDDGFLGKDSITNEQLKNSLFIKSGLGTIVDVSGSGLTRTIITENAENLILDLSYNINGDNVYRELSISSISHGVSISHSVSSVTLIQDNIEYPNTSLQFQVNFSKQQTSLSDICGNLQVVSSVSNIDTSSLVLTNYGFRLEGNIVADQYSKSDTNYLTYYESDDMSGVSVNFTINTNPPFELLRSTLKPENLVDSDSSATLSIEFNIPFPSDTSLNNYINIDPSYIATLGQMIDISNGYIWEGILTRTSNMNKLGNKLEFDFSYNGVEVSSNIIFDVVENSELLNQKWNLSNNTIVNKEFTKTIQMSPNGLLMGLVDGSNVEIYRKADISYTWNHDVSYNGHSVALTNNRFVIASDASLQMYDYSGTSWSIMNGGDITYSNVVALSINEDGTYVAVSDNSDVKVYKFVDADWIHYSTFDNNNVKGLSLSPNGLKLGMGIGNNGDNFSSIVVEDVVDTIPPIITLLGDASMSIGKDTIWEEPGYTATDNNDGDISNNVVRTGNVNVNTLGQYIIQYDVSDNAGNNASPVYRTVNVIYIPTIKYLNVNQSQDIFQLANMFSLFEQYRNSSSTLQTAKKANGASYLNGDYTVSCSSYRGDHDFIWFSSLFSGKPFTVNGLVFEFELGKVFNHHIYGSNFNKTGGGGLSNSGFTPYNITTETGTEIIDLINIGYFNTNTTSGVKTGEWIQIDLPFYINPSKFEYINTVNNVTGWASVHLVGSNDTNLNWQYLGNNTNTTGIGTFTMSGITSPSSFGYKHFRVIIDKVVSNRAIMENIKLYGDIYR